MPNYLSVKYLLISKKVELYLEHSKNWLLGGSIWGVPGGWQPQTMSNICLLNIYWYQKKSRTLPWAVQKIDFWEVHLGGFPGGWYPQTTSNYLSVKYLLISKTTSTLAWAVQKIDFLGPHFGGVPGEVAPKNFGRKNCICSSTTFHKN